MKSATSTTTYRSSKPVAGRASAPRGVRFSCSAVGLPETAEAGRGSVRVNSHQHPHNAITNGNAQRNARTAPGAELFDWFWRRSKDRATPTVPAVYFVAAKAARLVKIGMSKDVASRLATLRAGTADRLRLISWCAGGRPLERDLHYLLSKHRAQGEWFRPTLALFEAMGACLANQNDATVAFSAIRALNVQRRKRGWWEAKDAAGALS